MEPAGRHQGETVRFARAERAERGNTDPPLLRGPDAEPVVVRADPWPRRLLVRWRRAGVPEGRPAEFHPGRGLLLVGGLIALALWQAGAAVFLGMLAAIIVVHEAGHYVVARRCGMRPTEFFLGFGPTVWSHTTVGGLRFGIKAVLLGGYVKIPGMGPSEDVEASLEPYTYRAATSSRRLAVILAGVTANFVLALTLFWGYAMWNPAIDVGPVRAAAGSFSLMQEVSVQSVAGLADLVSGAGGYAASVASGSVPEDRMVSAVGGAQLTGGLLAEHPSRLLLLAGLFSTSIAVFNLLPLLPLDGGHAAIVIVEAAWARLRNRPRYRLDPNRFRVVAAIVVMALLALGLSSMYIDIVNPIAAGAG